MIQKKKKKKKKKIYIYIYICRYNSIYKTVIKRKKKVTLLP